MKKLLAIPFAVAIAAVASVSNADTFTENFNNGDQGDLVTTFAATDGATPDFSGQNALFPTTTGGNDSRSYLGTPATDYFANSFVATIDVDFAAGASGDDGFFGIGVGQPSTAGGNAFGEPSEGPAVYLNLSAGVENVDVAGPGNQGLPDGDLGSGQLVSEMDPPTTITFTYDADAGTLEFSSTVAGTTPLGGAFDPVAGGFDATNSRIFFGGSESFTFDNFTVTTAVPEPTSLALLGLGGLGFLVRRRRS